MNPNLRRIRTLRRLVNTFHVMSDRFPEHLTLAELNTALYAHLALAEGRNITVSQLASETQQHRQTISRWVQRTPYARLRGNPDDSRSKLIESTDLEGMLQYVDEVYETDLALLAMINQNGRLGTYLNEIAEMCSEDTDASAPESCLL